MEKVYLFAAGLVGKVVPGDVICDLRIAYEKLFFDQTDWKGDPAMQPFRVTDNHSNDQLLYFTSNSLLKDDRKLVFISDRTGSPNIFVKDLESGEEKQLTSNDEGHLKSYVYFDGNENRGLGKASISLHAQSGTIYYIQGSHICCTDINGVKRIVAELPPGQVTAFTHVSEDGSRLCVPTTDARALEGNTRGHLDYDIDRRVREEKLNSWLRVYDTVSGDEVLCEKVPEAWITHVQFCPLDPSLILYNHEWPSDCGIRRMWLWNGKSHIRLRNEDGKRSKEDWTCHEMWERNGKEIIYHGTYKDGASYVGKVNIETCAITEISFPDHYTKYGHFTVSDYGVLVSDGYYMTDEETSVVGEWISIQKVNWDSGNMEWIPICRHGSNWDSQDSHPHPIFNHSSTAVYFTSNKEGFRAVYCVDVPGVGFTNDAGEAIGCGQNRNDDPNCTR